MSSFADHIAADRRLCLLRLLLEAEGCANESVLETGLRGLGHNAGMDRAYVRAQLRELETLACIRIELFSDRVMVAHLLDRGANVARGHVTVPGIARPSFGG